MARHFSFTLPHMRGTALCAADRDYVLRSYVNRYTVEHVPTWAMKLRPNGRPYRVQFRSDYEWLDNTLFNVKKNGRLRADVTSCHSTPTWPHGLE